MANLHGLQPKQLARIGMFYLEEAVLDVLYHAKSDEMWMPPAQIAERLGIPKSSHYHLYATVHGALDSLASRMRVEHDNDKSEKKWKITEGEYQRQAENYGR